MQRKQQVQFLPLGTDLMPHGSAGAQRHECSRLQGVLLFTHELEELRFPPCAQRAVTRRLDGVTRAPPRRGGGGTAKIRHTGDPDSFLLIRGRVKGRL